MAVLAPAATQNNACCVNGAPTFDNSRIDELIDCQTIERIIKAVSIQTFCLFSQISDEPSAQSITLYNVKEMSSTNKENVRMATTRRGSIVVIKKSEIGSHKEEMENLISVLDNPYFLNTRGAFNSPDLGADVIVTEKAGENLHYLNRKLGIDQIRIIGSQMLKGLNIIHEKRKVHGDVKPGNIMVDRGGSNLKIIDCDQFTEFGKYAKLSGTINYAHPFRRAFMQAGPEVDLWSLGLTLYFSYTGKNIVELNGLSSKEKQECKNELRQKGLEVFEDAAIKLLVSLHKFREAFGEIPQEFINQMRNSLSDINDTYAEARKLLCDFLFVESESGYRLRNLTLPKSENWEERILEAGRAKGEDAEELVSFIKDLCSYKPKTAKELLSHPFIAKCFQFSLRFNDEFVKKYFKQGLTLQILDKKNNKNYVNINLNRSPESVEGDLLELLRGDDFSIKVLKRNQNRLFNVLLNNEVSIENGQTLIL